MQLQSVAKKLRKKLRKSYASYADSSAGNTGQSRKERVMSGQSRQPPQSDAQQHVQVVVGQFVSERAKRIAPQSLPWSPKPRYLTDEQLLATYEKLSKAGHRQAITRAMMLRRKIAKASAP